MKGIIGVGILLLTGIAATMAQDVSLLTENTTAKSQQVLINEFNNRSNVSLKFYPNPAVNFLVVEPVLHAGAGIIKIMDITGAPQSELHMEAGSNGITVDLSQYRPGLYVLAYYDDNNRLLHIGRFYKN